ncbi:hypothetical protein GF338_02045 [candidate division WOR-3 bacterium]|nr:hypothetical protein [candidate division WOR-3 bacterium]
MKQILTLTVLLFAVCLVDCKKEENLTQEEKVTKTYLEIEQWETHDYDDIESGDWLDSPVPIPPTPLVEYRGTFEVKNPGNYKWVYTTEDGQVLDSRWVRMPDITPGGYTIEIDEQRRWVTFINSAGEGESGYGVLVVKYEDGRKIVHGEKHSSE